MPPLLPTKPSSTAMAGQKRPSLLPAAGASPPRKKLFRPASAPCLPALSSSPASAAATKKVAPLSRPAPPSSAARPRPPPPSASRAPKKTAQQRPEAEAEAAPCRAAQSVHPTRRLACGTAVIVRTRLPLIPGRCCLLIWLPARVVSSTDAYHCTVKYAAYLHDIFAGKIVRVPAADVRPHRSSSAAAAAAKRPQAPS